MSTSGVLQWMEQLPEYQLQHRASFGPFANGENFSAYYPHFRLSLLLLPISTFSMIYFPSSFFSVNLFSFFHLFPNLFSFFIVFDYQFSFFHLFGNLFSSSLFLIFAYLPFFLPFALLFSLFFISIPFPLSFLSHFLLQFQIFSFFTSASSPPLSLLPLYLLRPPTCSQKEKNKKDQKKKKKEGERSRRVIPRTETKEEVGNKRKITGESFRFHVLARELHKKLDFTQNAFCFYMLKGLMADPTRLLTVSSRFYELNL